MVHQKLRLTHKQLETHVCVISTVATDALVLKHQAISMHNAGYIFIVLERLQLGGTIWEKHYILKKKYPVVYGFNAVT